MKDQERLELIDEYKAVVMNLTAGLEADGSESESPEPQKPPKD